MGVAIDITERKKMVEVLRQSEIMFRTMFREHGAVMFLVNPNSGIIEEANLSQKSIMDMSSMEIIKSISIPLTPWHEKNGN